MGTEVIKRMAKKGGIAKANSNAKARAANPDRKINYMDKAVELDKQIDKKINEKTNLIDSSEEKIKKIKHTTNTKEEKIMKQLKTLVGRKHNAEIKAKKQGTFDRSEYRPWN